VSGCVWGVLPHCGGASVRSGSELRDSWVSGVSWCGGFFAETGVIVVACVSEGSCSGDRRPEKVVV